MRQTERINFITKKKLKCQQVYCYKISQIIKLVKKSCIALHMAETPLLKLPGTCIILIFQKYVFYYFTENSSSKIKVNVAKIP